ncbi:MAG: OmpH family outer membrane protein [Chitinophagales bacterium]
MKKIILSLITMIALGASAQKVAFIESEYIFGKVKTYAQAQENIEKISQEWHKDIEDRMSLLDQQYKKFQAEQSLFTSQMRQEKIQEIETKEKEIASLQQKRFGPNGDLFKKRQELLQPITNRMLDEVQKIAQSKNYDMVLDKSVGGVLVYANSRTNISDDIIKAMGF